MSDVSSGERRILSAILRLGVEKEPLTESEQAVKGFLNGLEQLQEQLRDTDKVGADASDTMQVLQKSVESLSKKLELGTLSQADFEKELKSVQSAMASLSEDEAKQLTKQLDLITNGFKVAALQGVGEFREAVQQASKERGLDRLLQSLDGLQERADRASLAITEFVSVASTIQAVGDSIVQSAQQFQSAYLEQVGKGEEAARKWLDVTEQLEDAQVRLGRVATQSLTRILEKTLPIVESITSYIEKNPWVADAVINTGVTLAALGAASVAVAQVGEAIQSAQRLVTVIQQINALQGGMGTLARAGVAGGIAVGGLALAPTVGLGIGKGIAGGLESVGAIDQEYALQVKSQQVTDVLDTLFRTMALAAIKFTDLVKAIDLFIVDLGEKIAQFGIQAKIGIGQYIAQFGDALLTAGRVLAEQIIDIATKFAFPLNTDLQTQLAGALKDALPDLTSQDLIDMLGLDPTTIAQQSQEIQAIADQLRNNVNANANMLQQGILDFEASAEAFIDGFTSSTSDISTTLRMYSDETLQAFDNFQRETARLTEQFERQIADRIESFNKQQSRAQSEFERQTLKQQEEFAYQQEQNKKRFDKQLLDLEEQFLEDRADLLTDYQSRIAEIQADAETQRETFVIEQEEKLSEIRKEYRDNELEIQARFNKERLRALADHNDNLRDAASRLDAIGVLNELRRFSEQEERAKEDFDEQKQERELEFQERIKQEKIYFRESLDELNKSLDERLAEEKQAYEDQLTAQAENFNTQKENLLESFNEQNALAEEQFQRQLQKQREEFEYQQAQRALDFQDEIAQAREQHAEMLVERDQQFVEELLQQEKFANMSIEEWDAYYSELEDQLAGFIDRTLSAAESLNTDTSSSDSASDDEVTSKPKDKPSGNTPLDEWPTEPYTIKEGDSLWKIAQEFKTTVDFLKTLNPELKTDPYIYPGQKIKVPIPSFKDGGYMPDVGTLQQMLLGANDMTQGGKSKAGLAWMHPEEFIMNSRTSRLAEQYIGGSLSQERILQALAKANRSGNTNNMSNQFNFGTVSDPSVIGAIVDSRLKELFRSYGG